MKVIAEVVLRREVECDEEHVKFEQGIANSILRDIAQIIEGEEWDTYVIQRTTVLAEPLPVSAYCTARLHPRCSGRAQSARCACECHRRTR